MSETPPVEPEPGSRDDCGSAVSPAPAGDAPTQTAAAEESDRLETPVSLELSMDKLKLDLARIEMPATAGAAPVGDAAALQEELAEDMLDLMKKVNVTDAKLTALIAAVAQLQATLEAVARAHGMELDKLKETLVSERKELIGRSTFNALIPAMESLRFLEEMHEDKKQRAPLLKQTRNVLDMLTGITQALGYRPEDVQRGAAFDPYTMECVGYDHGEPGKVVRMERPGYRAGSVLVRPCRVILGKPPTVPPASATGVKGAKGTNT